MTAASPPDAASGVTGRSASFGVESRSLWRLAAPLIVNNLAVAGMQFADAVMAGKLGATALAAVAVGSSVWFLFFMVALGLMMAISPIVARHIGADTPQYVGRYTRQGLLLALLLSLPVIVIAQTGIGWFLSVIGIDVAFRQTTAAYVSAIAWGAPAMFMFLALRFTNEGVAYTRPIMLTSLLALACNVLLNWIFIYGKLGMPKLGAVGCGVASAITMWVIFVVLLSYMRFSPRYRAYRLFELPGRWEFPVIKEILALGIPIAVTVTAEAGLFNAVSLLMGTLGAEVAAAHQVALNFASTTFMVPLAISAATTVRVGYWLGRGEPANAKTAGMMGIASCAGIMMVSASALLLASEQIVSLYTTDTAVQNVATSLLLMAAIFQVADGLQVGAAGALRGYKDTKLPMIMTTFAYWVVAFPLAFATAVIWRLDPHLIWGGFVAGLCLAALMLNFRFWALTRPVAALPSDSA